MKPRTRRRAILALFSVLLALTAASWIRSVWFSDTLMYRWSHPSTQRTQLNSGFCFVGYLSGQFAVGVLWERRDDAPDERSFDASSQPVKFSGRLPWFRYNDFDDWAFLGLGVRNCRTPGLHIRNVMVPHWLVAMAFIAPIAFLIRRDRTDRRRARGQCPACAYDLKADFAPGCPECGWNRTPP